MHIDGYYSTGEFAKLAGVTVRTIRFYDKQNILKPSYLTEAGARFYTQEDLGRLQQILLLKYLGLSLEDIKDLIIGDDDYQILKNQLVLQRTLVQDKIEQMQNVQKALEHTIATIEAEHGVDWQHMQELISLTNMENTMKTQYQNSSNVNARINLHHLYSTNKQGWFPWVFEQMQLKPGMRILEIGCGNGALWTENASLLPEELSILLVDKSQGMIRDARRNIQASFEKKQAACFKYQVMSAGEAASIKMKNLKTVKTKKNVSSTDLGIYSDQLGNQEFDLIIANHVLFYFDDLQPLLTQIKNHLAPGGRFLCSTYGENHMRQIRELAKEFDERISLSGDALYEKFGLQNGKEKLSYAFSKEKISMKLYPDELIVTEPEPLLEYILSCHGNQNEYLLNRYKDFRLFLERKTKSRKGCHITKEAGVFIAEK